MNMTDLPPHPRTRLVRLLVWLTAAVVLLGSVAACGWVGGVGRRLKESAGAEIDIKVTISQEANLNHPIAVDLLFVYDPVLLEQLLAMPAKEWFQKREQLKREFYGVNGFDSWEWEWAPGEQVPPFVLPYKAMAVGGLVYADYYTPGEHRIRVNPHDHILIELFDEDFSALPWVR